MSEYALFVLGNLNPVNKLNSVRNRKKPLGEGDKSEWNHASVKLSQTGLELLNNPPKNFAPPLDLDLLVANSLVANQLKKLASQYTANPAFIAALNVLERELKPLTLDDTVTSPETLYGLYTRCNKGLWLDLLTEEDYKKVSYLLPEHRVKMLAQIALYLVQYEKVIPAYPIAEYLRLSYKAWGEIKEAAPVVVKADDYFDGIKKAGLPTSYRLHSVRMPLEKAVDIQAVLPE